jgi:hypothetical protein
MNASNGLIRIAKVFRWLGFIIFAVGVVGAFNSSEFFFMLLICGIPLCICLAAAYIIEGFAAKK